MSSVTLENLIKSYPEKSGAIVTAVNNINLTIRDREFMVLVGPSGCGKSTTLRMIAGLEEISSGTIRIGGEVVNEIPPKDRDIAMVFQNYALYPHLSVYENMAFGLILRKFPKTEIDRRVREVSAMLGLDGYLERKPKALSGGQRQRVAVGRAMVRDPKVFLFDEPLSNLDAKMRVAMRMELSRLHAKLGATMIYVTHDQTEAMTMGDRICVMKDGVIMQVDEPMRIYEHPANTFVAGFIGSPPMNLLSGRLESAADGMHFVEDRSGGEPLRLLLPKKIERLGQAQQNVILGVRPEDIVEPSATPGPWDTSLSLELAEPMGAETYLHLTTGQHSCIARVPPRPTPPPNSLVRVRFNLDQAHLFDAVSGVNLVPPVGAGV